MEIKINTDKRRNMVKTIIEERERLVPSIIRRPILLKYYYKLSQFGSNSKIYYLKLKFSLTNFKNF